MFSAKQVRKLNITVMVMVRVQCCVVNDGFWIQRESPSCTRDPAGDILAPRDPDPRNPANPEKDSGYRRAAYPPFTPTVLPQTLGPGGRKRGRVGGTPADMRARRRIGIIPHPFRRVPVAGATAATAGSHCVVRDMPVEVTGR